MISPAIIPVHFPLIFLYTFDDLLGIDGMIDSDFSLTCCTVLGWLDTLLAP
jgi:hypothetical protein